MKLATHLLSGVAALGLLVGFTSAADPVAMPPSIPLAELQQPTDARCDDTANQCGGICAGVGLYLIQPFFEGNLAYAVEVENQNPNPPFPPPGGTFHVLQRIDIKHHLEVAPLVWLGYIGESGLGGRARYWYFREGTNQTVGLPPSNGPLLSTVFSAAPLGLEGFGDTLSQPLPPPAPGTPEPTAVAITSKLEVQVADLEVLQDAHAGRWDFLCSGGVRLARIAQNYEFYNLQPTTVPAVARALLSSYNFQGVGPVLAVETRRPLADSGVLFFSTARGSMVFGSTQQNATFGGTVLRNLDANPQIARENRDRAIPIVELEAGVEYGRQVGSNWVFAQIALVGQDWLGAGNASRSAQNTFREGALVGGTGSDSDIAFLGLSFRLGVNY